MRIVVHRGGRLVPRRRDHTQHAAAQIEPRDLLRPLGNAEKRGNVCRFQPQNGGIGTFAKGGVSGNVIAVAVAVRDDERDAGAMMRSQPIRNQPIDGRPDPAVLGASIDQ
jgi:hypothetical protein